jgi:hypothetical protein
MKHHSRRAWQRKAAHLIASSKQRETEQRRGLGQDIFFKGMPLVT